MKIPHSFEIHAFSLQVLCFFFFFFAEKMHDFRVESPILEDKMHDFCLKCEILAEKKRDCRVKQGIFGREYS